jgi:hypothetical protein
MAETYLLRSPEFTASVNLRFANIIAAGSIHPAFILWSRFFEGLMGRQFMASRALIPEKYHRLPWKMADHAITASRGEVI